MVADALICQKNTAKAIIAGSADYLLCAKDNQETLKKDIEDYVQDKISQKSMDRESGTEKSRNRIEKRTAYITDDIEWLPNKNEWEGLWCIGAVHMEFEVNGAKNRRLALLYCQSEADSRGIAPSCPYGMVGGDDALAAACAF